MAKNYINKSNNCENFYCKYSWIVELISFAHKNVRQKRFSSRFTLHSSPRLAFTLAEVLITLGVIGVVAAMTIPALMKTFNDIQFKSAYKQAFSDAQNALNMANKDGLLSGDDYATNSQVHLDNFKVFIDQFKVTKECTNNNNSECWDSTGEKNGSYPFEASWAFTDSMGRSWSMRWAGARILFLDTNGFKKPNEWGKDRFWLYIYNDDKTSYADGIPTRIVPMIDKASGQVCSSSSGNKCYVEQNYFGTSWLYN